MTAAKLLTKSVLDAAGCDMPDCDHDHSVLYLNPACHPRERGVSVRYVKATGLIECTCPICGRPVASIEVAD